MNIITKADFENMQEIHKLFQEMVNMIKKVSSAERLTILTREEKRYREIIAALIIRYAKVPDNYHIFLEVRPTGPFQPSGNIDMMDEFLLHSNNLETVASKKWLSDNTKTLNMQTYQLINFLSPMIAKAVSKMETDFQKASIRSEKSVKKQVFISHGTPTNALNLLKEFLTGMGLEPVIVKDKPSKGMAVDDLVQMRLDECECMIVLATADDKVGDYFQARPNVNHEIGLGQNKFSEKIIYLLEENCHSPSNIAPKVYTKFTRDNLTEAFIKIVKELKDMQVI